MTNFQPDQASKGLSFITPERALLLLPVLAGIVLSGAVAGFALVPAVNKLQELEKLETNDQLQKFDHLISDFKNYILSKIPILKNNLKALESNSIYKEKYGVFITGMRERLVKSINISNTRKLGEEDLLEYINGPTQVTTEKSNKKKRL